MKINAFILLGIILLTFPDYLMGERLKKNEAKDMEAFKSLMKEYEESENKPLQSPEKGNAFSSMNELEGKQSDQEAIELLQEFGSLQQQLNNIVREDTLRCRRAFGHKIYCECLINSLPIEVDFLSYVAIISKTKNELNYKSLEKEDKKLIDRVYKKRDECVRKHLSTAK